MKKPILSITEDAPGDLTYSITCPDHYDLLDYGAFLGDALEDVAEYFGVPVEVIQEMVSLRLKFNQLPREEIERQLATTH